MQRTDILGVGFDSVTADEASRFCETLICGTEKGYIVTPNPEIVVECEKNDALREAVDSAALVVPDGIGVIYASRILKHPLPEKVAGIELGERICRIAAQNGKKLFLLGAKPGVAELAAEKLAEKYEGLCIAGVNDGYFSDEEAIVEKINSLSPDAVFVCLGSPKQELFMKQNADRLNVRLMIGLGGSLDIYSGNAKRAPRFLIKIGLEWLYRLANEPKRIGRMMKLPVFLVKAVLVRIKRRGKNEG